MASHLVSSFLTVRFMPPLLYLQSVWRTVSGSSGVFDDSTRCSLQIDFVAHDDIPYSSAGSDDVYKHIKEAGENHSCLHITGHDMT